MERELRQAVGMLRAAHRLLFRAVGAQVIEQGWQPGRELGGRLRRLHSAAEDVERALRELERVVGERGDEPVAGRGSDG